MFCKDIHGKGMLSGMKKIKSRIKMSYSKFDVGCFPISIGIQCSSDYASLGSAIRVRRFLVSGVILIGSKVV